MYYVFRPFRCFKLALYTWMYAMHACGSGLHLWEYTLDLSTGQASQRRVINDDYRTYEFPQV